MTVAPRERLRLDCFGRAPAEGGLADDGPADGALAEGGAATGDSVTIDPDWFWETDPEQRLTAFRAANAAARLPDWRPGRTWREVIRKQGGAPDICNLLAGLMARGEPLRGVVYSVPDAGCGRRWIQIFGRPIRDAAGRIVAYRGIGCDITERHEVPPAPRAALEAAARSKADFLSNLHHELRTPLNAILGFAQIMNRGIFGPIAQPQYRAYVADIEDSAQRLLGVIVAMLDYAALRAGRMRLEEEPVALPDLIADALPAVAPQAAARRIGIALRVPAGLPRLRADRQRLRQALLALIDNAIKFTPPGGRLSINAAARAGCGLALMIRDTGVGMSREEIPRLLEPFERSGDRLTRCQEGVGVGLPLAKALVELHDGRVTLRSAPGRGTEVEILLPPERILGEPTAG